MRYQCFRLQILEDQYRICLYTVCLGRAHAVQSQKFHTCGLWDSRSLRHTWLAHLFCVCKPFTEGMSGGDVIRSVRHYESCQQAVVRKEWETLHWNLSNEKISYFEFLELGSFVQINFTLLGTEISCCSQDQNPEVLFIEMLHNICNRSGGIWCSTSVGVLWVIVSVAILKHSLIMGGKKKNKWKNIT